jgi:hypothetical protein
VTANASKVTTNAPLVSAPQLASALTKGRCISTAGRRMAHSCVRTLPIAVRQAFAARQLNDGGSRRSRAESTLMVKRRCTEGVVRCMQHHRACQIMLALHAQNSQHTPRVPAAEHEGWVSGGCVEEHGTPCRCSLCVMMHGWMLGAGGEDVGTHMGHCSVPLSQTIQQSLDK